MKVDTLIENYFRTNDSDVKYMLLKDEVIVEDVENDIPKLIDELYIPILIENSNIEICDLVISLILPNLIYKYLYLINESQYKDDEYFNKNIIEKFITVNNVSLVLALKRILDKLNDNNCRVVNYCDNSHLIIKMFEHISSDNKLLYFETINSLLKFLFNINECNKISSEMFEEIIANLFIKNDFEDEMIEEVILAISDNSSCADNTKFFKFLVGRGGNYNILRSVTKNWYKFNVNIEEIVFKNFIHQELIRFVQFGGRDDEERISNVLEILKNLRTYYDINVVQIYQKSDSEVEYDYTDNKKYISNEIISEIIETIAKLERKIIEQKNLEGDVDMECEIEEEVLDEQQEAYINELDDDDDDEIYEEELTSLTQVKEDNILHQIQEINDIIVKSSTQETEDSELINKIELNKNNLIEIDNIINNEKNLDNKLIDALKIYEIITANNKEYINILKVGNLKQSYDTSNVIKIKLLNIILYNVSYNEDNNYGLQMRTLYDLMKNNFKIKQSIINGNEDNEIELNNKGLKILALIMKNYKKIIQTINYNWYNETIHKQLMKKITKINNLLNLNIKTGQDLQQLQLTSNHHHLNEPTFQLLNNISNLYSTIEINFE